MHAEDSVYQGELLVFEGFTMHQSECQNHL